MTTTLAFCFFQDDLATVAPEWPAGAGFAYVSAADGRDGFVLFHEDELDRLGARIAGAADTPAPAVAAFPAVPGCARLKVQFAERVKLLDELAWRVRSDLCDAAATFMMAYRFARDEGLDVDAYMQDQGVVFGDLARPAADAEDTARGAPQRPTPPGAVAADTAPGDSDADTAEAARPTTAPPAPPAPGGYSRLSPRECRLSEATTGTIRLTPGGFVAIAPPYAADAAITLPRDRLFVRDDLKGLAIDMVDYGEGISTRFLVPADHVPRPILRRLEAGGAGAHLARVGRYLHVAIESSAAPGRRTAQPDMVHSSPPSAVPPAHPQGQPSRGLAPRLGRRAAAAVVLFLAFGVFEHRAGAQDAHAHSAPAVLHPEASRLAVTLGRLSTEIDPGAAFR